MGNNFKFNQKWNNDKNIFTDSFYIKEKLVDDFKELLNTGVIVKRDNCHTINCKGENKYLKIIDTV